jgi:tetratricopeptide (TPR) repeat protein
VRRGAWAAIGIALLSAAGAAAFFLLQEKHPRADQLSAMLPAVDAAIAGGSLDTARSALESLRVLPAAEEDLLRLLKRAFAVCGATGDFRLMDEMCRRALAANGRIPRVRAAAAYAQLRTGRVQEAGRTVARGGLPPGTAELLGGEAALRGGRSWPGSDGLTRDLVSLEKNRDPSAFSAAAVRTGDSRLFLDAAVLLMEQGAADAALRIVQRDLAEAAYDEPASVICWDAGEPAEAMTRLRRLEQARPGRAEIQFRLADCLQAVGRDDLAEKALLRGLPAAPRLSWTPYASLAFFAARRGDLALAERRLQDGLAFFPGARELLIARAKVAAADGHGQQASGILSALLAERPDDYEAALVLLDLQAPDISPEQYRARLWKLFNRAPAAAEPFMLLASAVIGARDWEAASMALDQHEAAVGAGGADLLLLRGMIEAMRGKSRAAEAAFRRAGALRADGRARYNLALVMLNGGQGRAALGELSLAAEELARSGIPGDQGKVQSRIAMLSGMARLVDGDETGAREALSRALALDPHNQRAGLLLRKLEAGVQ